MSKINYISIAKKSAEIQINELKKIKKIFNKSFTKAVDLILNCKGKVILAGLGKSGLIARKISATLSSVGVPSFFVIQRKLYMVTWVKSKKRYINNFFIFWKYLELSNMLKYANRYRIKIIGVASKPESILLKASDVKLVLPKVKESDMTGMVPTSSTSITLLLGDCLATTVMHQKKFSKEKFKLYHPGGNIGNTLLLAKDIMVSGKKMPVINYKKDFKDALKIMNQKKLGIVVILKNKFIKGIVTDGDLRRELKNYSKDKNLNQFMKKSPLVVNENMPASKLLDYDEKNNKFACSFR